MFISITTLQSFFLLDPARNIRIDPIKETYTVNDTITCSANGYPVPDITWSYLVESDSGHQLPGSEKNESILEIDETWVGHKYDLVCTASNIVSGLVTTISANISFSVGEETQIICTIVCIEINYQLFINVFKVTVVLAIASSA